jgi:hypothetical protein
MLLRSRSDLTLLVGVARWASEDELLQFRHAAGTLSFEGAELEGIEVLDEIDDLTVW